jgi:hypothetical protein
MTTSARGIELPEVRDALDILRQAGEIETKVVKSVFLMGSSCLGRANFCFWQLCCVLFRVATASSARQMMSQHGASSILPFPILPYILFRPANN